MILISIWLLKKSMNYLNFLSFLHWSSNQRIRRDSLHFHRPFRQCRRRRNRNPISPIIDGRSSLVYLWRTGDFEWSRETCWNYPDRFESVDVFIIIEEKRRTTHSFVIDTLHCFAFEIISLMLCYLSVGVKTWDA